MTAKVKVPTKAATKKQAAVRRSKSAKIKATTKRTKIVKKRTARFFRFQSDLFNRVDPSWRKPRGIDNRQRRRFKGTAPMPTIGYGSNKATRYQLANGLYPVVVRKPEDVNLLLMVNDKYAAVIARRVGAKSRKAIIERAAQLSVKVVNKPAKVTSQEKAA